MKFIRDSATCSEGRAQLKNYDIALGYSEFHMLVDTITAR